MEKIDKKTAEDFLDAKCLHWMYWPCGDSTKEMLHDVDCKFCDVESPVLEAMEEYAEHKVTTRNEEVVKMVESRIAELKAVERHYVDFRIVELQDLLTKLKEDNK